MHACRAATPVVLALGALLVPCATPVSNAHADQATVIRFASLAPPGSAFMKVMRAWNRSVKKETDNRVDVRFYSGGSQGDDLVGRVYSRSLLNAVQDAAKGDS